MHEVCARQECCGCSACFNSCPAGCISMVPDEEGFLYPVIDEARCTECEECISVCQVHSFIGGKPRGQRFYAVKHANEIRMNSSSGGAFTALSDYVLASRGVIVGAVLNEDFTVSHCIAEDAVGRDPMRGSKYVQSDLGDVFRGVKRELDRGRQVLFSGTPCQVEGLRRFLGNSIQNLLTCDLVCRGAPSPSVFKSFIDYAQIRGRSSLVEFRFRDKEYGWRGYTVSARYANGSKFHATTQTPWLKSFHYLFIHDLINRPCCSKCRHMSLKRCSDITIGDYWSVRDYYPELEDRLGVSLVITNTEAGDRLFDLAFQDTAITEIGQQEVRQNALTTFPKVNKLREDFWECFQEEGYERAIKEYGELNLKGYIKDIARGVLMWASSLRRTACRKT